MNRLSPNNPYARSVIFEYVEGDLSLHSYTLPIVNSVNDILHVVESTDTFWHLAGHYWEDPKAWWIIWKVNIDLCLNPFELGTLEGKAIVIPDYDKYKAYIL